MSTRRPLTVKQRAVYNYMVEFFNENDQLPPTRSIQAEFGHLSQNTAVQSCLAIQKKGYLTKNAVSKQKFVRPIEPPQ